MTVPLAVVNLDTRCHDYSEREFAALMRVADEGRFGQTWRMMLREIVSDFYRDRYHDLGGEA